MAPKDKPADAGQAEAQENVAQAEEQGFIGTETDQTPNENYTVAGVTKGATTPETAAQDRGER